MILYFSATGNCKYVATKIANAMHDRIISITECVTNENFTLQLSEGEQLGIVCPTYFWGLPTLVQDFFDKVRIDAKNPYIYFVSTYGATPGQTRKFIQRAIKKQGYQVNANFGVQMPDTWTPLFNLGNPEKLNQINAKADVRIDFIIEKLHKKIEGDFINRQLPFFAAKLNNSFFYDRARKTSHLKLSNTCIGCGLCALKCPAHAIKMDDKKPVWIKDHCEMCLGCLHRCPVAAIEYGRSKKHGQYKHPHVEV